MTSLSEVFMSYTTRTQGKPMILSNTLACFVMLLLVISEWYETIEEQIAWTTIYIDIGVHAKSKPCQE